MTAAPQCSVCGIPVNPPRLDVGADALVCSISCALRDVELATPRVDPAAQIQGPASARTNNQEN